MFRISGLTTDDSIPAINELIRLLDGLEFDVTIKQTNSKQLDSNIDAKIEEAIGRMYKLSKAKQDLLVQANGEKIGELDLVYWDDDGFPHYLEVEKSNKKTLWFDYIKILTKLAENEIAYGIILSPSNYAHKVGVWNLYKEAVAYKGHLSRLFGGGLLDRVGVVGYTQYAFLGGDWVAFNPNDIKKLKDT